MKGTTRRDAWVEAFGVASFFALVTVWLFWTAFRSPWDTVLATPGPIQADEYLIAWILAWDCHALWNYPSQLFDANTYYPAKNVLAGSEHMLGHLPFFAPIFALTHNPAAAIQANCLASFTLCGVAMYALLRHWGTGRAAALFGGFVYAFCPTRYLRVQAIQLAAVGYLPLVLLFFDRALDRGRVRDGIMLAFALLLQMMCSFYIGYISVLVVGVYAVIALWLRARSREPIHWMVPFLSLVAAGAAMIPTSLPYLYRPDLPDFSGGYLAGFSAQTVRSYLQRPQMGKFGGAYTGLLPGLLAVFAVIQGFRLGMPAARYAALALSICVVNYVLSLGPELRLGEMVIPLPYDLLNSFVPGFSAMRAPFRFVFGYVLGLSALAGLGFHALMTRVGNQTLKGAIVVGVFLITALDFGHFQYDPKPLKLPVHGSIPQVYETLAELPTGPVVEIPSVTPYGMPMRNREGLHQYMSIFHRQPSLNGYSGYAPPSAAVIARIANMLPDPGALKTLQRMTGLRYVIAHLNYMGPEQRAMWDDPPGLDHVAGSRFNALFRVESDLPPDSIERVREGSPRGRTMLGNTAHEVPTGERMSDVSIGEIDRVLRASRLVPVVVDVANLSESVWPVLTDSPDVPVELHYRWYGSDGVQTTGTAPLPFDIEPDQHLRVPAALRLPKNAGIFDLEVAVGQGSVRFPGAVTVTGIEVGPK